MRIASIKYNSWVQRLKKDNGKVCYFLSEKSMVYLAPGFGKWYLIPISSSRSSSLWPRALANDVHSSLVFLILSSLFSMSSHSDLCQALSAKATSRGNTISCSCSAVRTVSVHIWPCIPKRYFMKWCFNYLIIRTNDVQISLYTRRRGI